MSSEFTNSNPYFEVNALDTITEEEHLQNPFSDLVDHLPQNVKHSLLTWRMRSPWSLPQSWQEIAAFVGFALAIKCAYSVFWPGSDVAPGDFPIENINPLKRRGEGTGFLVDATKTPQDNDKFIQSQQTQRQQIVLGMVEHNDGNGQNIVSQDQVFMNE